MTEEYFKKNDQGRWVLEGENAIALWQQGAEVWNAEVANFPEADVDFECFNFNHIKGPIYFDGFEFPKKGTVSFSRVSFIDQSVSFRYANFGDGDVLFHKTVFGSGQVDFRGATFGSGQVHFLGAIFCSVSVTFEDADFGDGNATFRGAEFGDETVDFNNATFGDGIVDFNNATFGDGIVDFFGATFNRGKVNFCRVNFGNGDVDFSQTIFGGGDITFANAEFGQGRVSFAVQGFGNGNVDFSGATFGCRLASFRTATCGGGEYWFNHAIFHGHADFSDLKNCETIQNLSFTKTIFEKSFDLTNNKFICIPDLVGTKIGSHASLHGVHCELKRKPLIPIDFCKWMSVTSRSPATTETTLLFQAENPDDIAKLRRLKELAESNRDHAAALRFHADEMRAKRWNKDQGMGWGKSILDLLYSATSNYGQSIGRPFGWLLAVSAVFCFYLFKHDIGLVESAKVLLANTVPFVASAKTVLDSHKDVAGVLMIHGLLSFVFIFLIGLGFRNRFRV